MPLDGSGGKAIPIQPKLVVLYLAMVANGLVPMGGFVSDFEDGSASFAARGGRARACDARESETGPGSATLRLRAAARKDPYGNSRRVIEKKYEVYDRGSLHTCVRTFSLLGGVRARKRALHGDRGWHGSPLHRSDGDAFRVV